MACLARIERVVRIEPIAGADAIELAHIRGWQTVVRKGEFREGDAGVFFQVDSILPVEPRYEFLRRSCYKKWEDGTEGFRLRSARLRGALSQGVLMPLAAFPELAGTEEADLTERLGVRKYEPPIPVQMAGDALPSHPKFLKYRDLERLQNHPTLFRPDERVVVLEKVHGTNARFAVLDGEFCVGGHHYRFDPEGGSIFAVVARAEELRRKIERLAPGLVFFGEVYGRKIQSWGYGLMTPSVVFYDIYGAGGYLSWEECARRFREADVAFVPPIYEGTFGKMPAQVAEGISRVGAWKDHPMEGVVIRPAAAEEFDSELGIWRALKHKSEKFSLAFE